MFEIKDRPEMVERALLIGTCSGAGNESEAVSLLEELEELVNTLGVPVIERMLVHLREPNARYLIGSGKAHEIRDLVREAELDCIVFDHELTPAQQRNWEALSEVCVIDRQEVILDIFARRARTREARLQVEVARLEYSLPRLTRAWGHLGKQAGGIGSRGEGESQLEQDRRAIRGQLDRLKADLVKVRNQRATQRKDRKRTPVPTAAIVGYTNAGKSSLLRRLTGADVLVEDKLFATLDTTTRKVVLPNNQTLLLTDTVGFVRKLPHQLVEAFNATLEEAVFSNFLIHLIDASHPEAILFYNTTMKVLEELGADITMMLVVFNKIDKITDPSVLPSLRLHYPAAQFISVKTGEGLDNLLKRLEEFLAEDLVTLQLRIPHARTDIVARAHSAGEVLALAYESDAVRLKVVIPCRLTSVFEAFVENPPVAEVAPEISIQ
jgi:GTP-binding protein HflX